MTHANILEQLAACVGSAQVLTGSACAPYETDQRKRFTGKALAVVRPASTEEVAALVRVCHAHRIPIVPQGGNTGLVLGSVPDSSGTALILSLTRMNRIRQVDTDNNTLVAEAGCPLDQVCEVAAQHQRLFPLAMASSGTCTIGGNLAVNAGGTAVLRYGTARELCLGLEVVTADGTIWDGLTALRKNNTGYDLRDLYIGSEGTLGIITAAVLKLWPQPRTQMTALVALSSVHQALHLLHVLQVQAHQALSGFELMSGYSLQLVRKHFPDLQMPLSLDAPQYVLLELVDEASDSPLRERLEDMLGEAVEKDIISDAVMAQSLAQAHTLWQWRHNISEAQAREAANIKHDIAVPVSALPEFLEYTDAMLQQHFPGCRPVTFGHLGDGSLHYNVAAPAGVSDEDFLAQQSAVNQVVYDSVYRFGGVLSAEHGLGALKHRENAVRQPEVQQQLMRHIKMALDPLGIMNPGKVLL